MSRTYHRTARTSAAPSRANWEPLSPRECTGCQRKLRITKDRIWFRMFPVVESWCDACTPKWKLTGA